jgi:homopolymeric O-antigen transport system permease protein
VADDQGSSRSALLTPRREQPGPPVGSSVAVEAGRERDTGLTVIRADQPRVGVELRELWRARETALVFAWRDVKVRYKQSLIGFAWAIIQPLFTMVVFTYVFGHFAKIPTQGLNVSVFFYLGLLPWTFFASSLTQISGSVLSNRQLVQKVYFPRLILPLSGLLVPTIDFLCSAFVLAGIMIVFHVGVGWTVLLAPFFLLLLGLIALGVGAFFATINVRYRDVPYMMGFIVSVWLYLSPVIYGTATLPKRWQVLSSLNPVSLAITGFRWAIGGTPAPTTIQWVLGLSVTTVMLVVGLAFYRRWESRFADTL